MEELKTLKKKKREAGSSLPESESKQERAFSSIFNEKGTNFMNAEEEAETAHNGGIIKPPTALVGIQNNSQETEK